MAEGIYRMSGMRRVAGTISQYVPASRHLYLEAAAGRKDTYVHVRKGFCPSGSSLRQNIRASTSGEKKGAAISDTEDVEKLDILFRLSLFFDSAYGPILLFVGNHI